MADSGGDDESSGPGPLGSFKSPDEKKTRIHLADLEKRLVECHTSCREADLQRAAFKDLQIENLRLRDLLRIAGVNEVLTDSYVNQGLNQVQDSNSSLRHIRPRIALQSDETSNGRGWRDASASPYSDGSTMSLTHSSLKLEPTSAFHPSPASGSGQNMTVPPRQQQVLDSTTQQTAQLRQQPSIFSQPQDTFCCDTFHIAPIGPLLETQENTILCSVAKDILEQYNVNAIDMEMIKARLASGFAKPSYPGQGCRVDNQLLFQILNEISTRIS